MELKDCPFCNDSKYLKPFLGALSGRMMCNNCGAVGPHVSFEDDFTIEEMNEAITTAWNARADDWRPIETAPKDRAIDIYSKSTKERFTDCVFDCGAWQFFEPDGWSEIKTPTHWKPIPEGPK